jgi:hypothetical protein
MAKDNDTDMQEAIERMKSGSNFVKKYIEKSLEEEKEADLPSVMNGPTDEVAVERLKKQLNDDKGVEDDE